MLVILGGHSGIYHATVWFVCFLFVFFCGDLMFQSIPSLTIPIPPPRAKPGQFFDGQIPHPRAKRVQNPHLRAYKNELKPHHWGHFPRLFTIKT